MSEKLPATDIFAVLTERKSLMARLGLASLPPSKWERTTGADLLGDTFDFSVKAKVDGEILISWKHQAAGIAGKDGWEIRIGPGAGGKMRVIEAKGTPTPVATIKDAGILVRDALKKSMPKTAEKKATIERAPAARQIRGARQGAAKVATRTKR